MKKSIPSLVSMGLLCGMALHSHAEPGRSDVKAASFSWDTPLAGLNKPVEQVLWARGASRFVVQTADGLLQLRSSDVRSLGALLGTAKLPTTRQLVALSADGTQLKLRDRESLWVYDFTTGRTSPWSSSAHTFAADSSQGFLHTLCAVKPLAEPCTLDSPDGRWRLSYPVMGARAATHKPSFLRIVSLVDARIPEKTIEVPDASLVFFFAGSKEVGALSQNRKNITMWEVDTGTERRRYALPVEGNKKTHALLGPPLPNGAEWMVLGEKYEPDYLSTYLVYRTELPHLAEVFGSRALWSWPVRVQMGPLRSLPSQRQEIPAAQLAAEEKRREETQSTYEKIATYARLTDDTFSFEDTWVVSPDRQTVLFAVPLSEIVTNYEGGRPTQSESKPWARIAVYLWNVKSSQLHTLFSGSMPRGRSPLFSASFAQQLVLAQPTGSPATVWNKTTGGRVWDVPPQEPNSAFGAVSSEWRSLDTKGMHLVSVYNQTVCNASGRACKTQVQLALRPIPPVSALTK